MAVMTSSANTLLHRYVLYINQYKQPSRLSLTPPQLSLNMTGFRLLRGFGWLSTNYLDYSISVNNGIKHISKRIVVCQSYLRYIFKVYIAYYFYLLDRIYMAVSDKKVEKQIRYRFFFFSVFRLSKNVKFHIR